VARVASIGVSFLTVHGNGAECRQLVGKINNIRKKIAESITELMATPGRLTSPRFLGRRIDFISKVTAIFLDSIKITLIGRGLITEKDAAGILRQVILLVCSCQCRDPLRHQVETHKEEEMQGAFLVPGKCNKGVTQRSRAWKVLRLASPPKNSMQQESVKRFCFASIAASGLR